MREITTISIKDMLNTMMMRGQDRDFIPFSIEFVTCDQHKHIGGKLIRFDHAVFVGGPSRKAKDRNPNHYENNTRNIRHLNSDRMVKIHTHLVLKFNGMEVVQ